MSYDVQGLYAALQRADAAGDTEAARAIAGELVSQQQAIHAEAQRGATANPADPTEGMSGLERATAGFGRAFANTGRGLGQLVGAVPQSQVDDAARADAPLLATGGGMAGNIAGNVAQMLAPGAGAGKLAQVAGLVRTAPAAVGAATGGLFGATQPTVGDETRLGNVAKEGALGAVGGGVAQGIGALARGGSEALSPAVKALAQKAEAYGIPLSASQLSDSTFVKTLQSALGKLPFSGQGKFYEGQQEAFNRAISKTFGEDAGAITSDVAQSAKRRLGSEFERLSATNSLQLTQPVISDLGAVVQKAAQNATPENAALVQQQAEAIIGKSANGVIPGQAYREMDSQLGRLMKGTQDGDRKYYLGQVRDVLRNAMDSNIGPADQAAWKAARGQYRNLKTVEDLVEKAPTGNISPALLMGRVRANTSDMAYGGGGDLADLSRIGQKFLKSQVPDSGTAQRMVVYELMKAGALGGAGTMAGADPMTILSMMALGRGGSAAMNSKLLAKYMQQGLGSAAPALEGLGQSAPYLLPAYGGQ